MEVGPRGGSSREVGGLAQRGVWQRSSNVDSGLQYSRSRMDVRSPVDSSLEAVLTVSPNKQYRGIFNPTTPATQGPAK